MPWAKEIKKLEDDLDDAKDHQETHNNAKTKIKIGTIIRDLEANTLAKVEKLVNGSNDFEARSLDGLRARGYIYLWDGIVWEVVEDYSGEEWDGINYKGMTL